MHPIVVVTAPTLSALGTLPERLRRCLPAVDVDVVVPMEACARQVEGRDIRLLVGRVDAPRDLAPLRGIRRARPTLPIVVAGPRLLRESGDVPLPDGPTTWAPSMRSAAAIARHLEAVLGLRKAVGEGLSHLERSRVLVEETRSAVDEGRMLRETTKRNLNRSVRPVFAPLLVEPDAEQEHRIVRAFEEVEADLPVAVVRSAAEAVAYLSGREPYEDRLTWPPPTLVLLDLQLPDRSGLDLLRWIRESSPVPNIPVVALGRSLRAEDIDRAYAQRANSVLVQPEGDGEAVQMARALHYYWTRLNIIVSVP